MSEVTTRWFRVWTSNQAMPLVEATCHPERHFTSGDTVSWYATIPGFGCSKSYTGPRSAIVNMLADHAVTVLRIKEIDRAGNFLP